MNTATSTHDYEWMSTLPLPDLIEYMRPTKVVAASWVAPDPWPDHEVTEVPAPKVGGSLFPDLVRTSTQVDSVGLWISQQELPTVRARRMSEPDPPPHSRGTALEPVTRPQAPTGSFDTYMKGASRDIEVIKMSMLVVLMSATYTALTAIPWIVFNIPSLLIVATLPLTVKGWLELARWSYRVRNRHKISTKPGTGGIPLHLRTLSPGRMQPPQPPMKYYRGSGTHIVLETREPTSFRSKPLDALKYSRQVN